MQETHRLLSTPKSLPPTIPTKFSKPITNQSLLHHHHHDDDTTKFPSLSSKSTTPVAVGPTSSSSSSSSSSQEFQTKLLYLDSLGIDILDLLHAHPHLLTTPLSTLKSSTRFLLTAAALSPADLRRVALLCPESLTLSVPLRLSPVVSFLLTEALVPPRLLPRLLARRPRLLASPVPSLLRPTLHFLRSLGIPRPHAHPNLLTSPVDTKLLPRLRYVAALGFSPRDAASMFRRFPHLFCYSVAGNLQPKFDYFVLEMGRDLRELRDFPHYFSFSLENRIKPRHRRCVERGVCFPLPVLLKTNDQQFRSRLELCCETSLPRLSSPLSCTDDDQLIRDQSLVVL